MSAIGRIFIVLNLILAAAFLGWATSLLSSVEDWRQKHDDAVAAHSTAIAEKEAEISGHRNTISSLEDGQRTFREERDDAKARVTELEGSVADATRQNQELANQIAGINSTLGDYNSTIAQLTQQKDAATERAHEAENARDDATAASQAAELAKRDADENSRNLGLQISDLEAKNAELGAQVSSLDTEITTLVALTGVDRGQFEPVPQIEAAVLEASFDSEPGLVLLNVGKNSGVKRGYTFEIFRGNQYKGRVRVENVQDSFCSAIVTGVNDGRTISQGDRASTIL